MLVLFPACPTRKEHLSQIVTLVEVGSASGQTLEVRLLPLADRVSDSSRRAALPPTVIQAHSTPTGQSFMSIGSVADAGYDDVIPGSLNFVFRPDDALRDAWRRWFQYTFTGAAPLDRATAEIPHLVPAQGDPEAARLWKAFEDSCQGRKESSAGGPSVDGETGEVSTSHDGQQVVAWDEGKTALDPLALAFQRVYSGGWLVTVDEATRIRPLAVPVKATLLGQQSERTVGSLRQRQSFTLQVLDDSAEKAVEKCRKVTDLMELLTCSLSQGNRWLPDAAKALLEKELALRNEQGQQALWDALGGKDIAADAAEALLNEQLRSGSSAVQKSIRDAVGDTPITPDDAKRIVGELRTSGDDEIRRTFTEQLGATLVTALIHRRTDSIRNDLNKMYRELGQGDAVPADKRDRVLDDIRQRLTLALATRIAPRALYNRISAPDLTETAPAENWNQPLSLLARSARMLRESMTDPYFLRRFSGVSFEHADFLNAFDVFGDAIVASKDMGRARRELEQIDDIIDADLSAKEKCRELWHLIKRGPTASGLT